MLRKISDLHGYAIAATDGALGTVSDFLFDDESWRVRWLVVDTGGWLSGRKVLLPPSALGHIDADGRRFSVRLSRAQVKDSPEIASDQPVSRQMESHVYDYYGWSPYWSTGFYMGGMGMGGIGIGGMGMGAAGLPREERQSDLPRGEHYENAGPDGDQHLRSAAAVAGTHIHATDGEIGHVADFLLEDGDWSLRFLVVDTSNWWVGKQVVISPRSVREIDWSDGLVDLDVSREAVRNSPLYDAGATLDREYERAFHRYYDDHRRGPAA